MSFPRSQPCSRRHTVMTGGTWLLGDDDLMALLMTNGRRQLHAVCPDCGETTAAIPHRYATMPIDSYPIYQDNTGKYLRPPHECEVVGCESPDTQYHHWAPHGVFGRLLDPDERPPDNIFTGYESDLWPTSYLCQRHHTEWHGRMVDYRWNRRRRAG